jgi:hypothetical protein
MLRGAVLGAAIACLITGGAYAQDETEGDNECTQQLSATEESVHDKIEANVLSEADAMKINELLDQADALCDEGKFPEASATLDTINKMVASGQ